MYMPNRAGRAQSAGHKKFPPVVTREDRFAPVVGVRPLLPSAVLRARETLSTGRTFHGEPMTFALPSLARTRPGRKVVGVASDFAPSALPADRSVSGVKSLVNRVMTSPGDGDAQQRITPAITGAAHSGRRHGAVTR